MYRYIREDDGRVVEVGFELAITQDATGRITLPDGVQARRLIEPAQKKKQVLKSAIERVPDSDALGFSEIQYQEFEADRKRNNFQGVEFYRDPTEHTFFRVRFSDHGQRRKYMKHRGFVDRGSVLGSAGSITQADLEAASSRVKEKYGAA